MAGFNDGFSAKYYIMRVDAIAELLYLFLYCILEAIPVYGKDNSGGDPQHDGTAFI